MKTLLIIIAALSATAAYAGDINESPIRGKPTGYTTEQINRALQWLGRPEHEQIGRARVLYDDSAPAPGVTRSESTNRTIIYHR